MDRALDSAEVYDLFNYGKGLQYPFILSPPNITSTLVCSGCTPPAISPYKTPDTTPEFQFNTDVNAFCRMADEDLNYTVMGNTRNCYSGENTTFHNCILSSQDELTNATDYIYLSCVGQNGAESDNSTSGPIQMNITGLPELILVGLNESEFGKVYDHEESNQTYIQEYVLDYSNLTEVNYINVSGSENEVLTTLNIGGIYIDQFAGYKINDLKYGIHLLICEHQTNSCAFRINGVPTGRIYNASVTGQSNYFNINQEVKLVINNLKINECGNQFFCDVPFEAYDKVNISLVRR